MLHFQVVFLVTRLRFLCRSLSSPQCLLFSRWAPGSQHAGAESSSNAFRLLTSRLVLYHEQEVVPCVVSYLGGKTRSSSRDSQRPGLVINAAKTLYMSVSSQVGLKERKKEKKKR